jgi:DNA-binding transcriptional LysR family regulator
MDIELARTFLEIVASGSFIRAAEHLHVTQTTVSARIRSLELQLGRRLFVRNKAGASLTAYGEQFLRFAPSLVQMWEHARHQVAVPAGRRALLSVGGELSLWNPLLLNWLVWMKRHAGDIALRAQVGVPEDLMRQVSEGALEIALLYTPSILPGLRVEPLLEERLVLVTTARRRSPKALHADYVFVDWGVDFARNHNRRFPNWANPGVFVSLGPLGLGYILQAGGTGYFRLRAVRPYLESRRLRLVRGAPQFHQTVYLVHSANTDATLVEAALRGFRAVAAEEHEQQKAGAVVQRSRQ